MHTHTNTALLYSDYRKDSRSPKVSKFDGWDAGLHRICSCSCIDSLCIFAARTKFEPLMAVVANGINSVHVENFYGVGTWHTYTKRSRGAVLVLDSILFYSVPFNSSSSPFY